MSGRNSVSYVKPSEPAFITRIKEKVGFKEGPTIETKREKRPLDDDDDDSNKGEKDDEKPVVVVLEPGDLSQEEADKIYSKIQDKEEPEDEDLKITFKKPIKRLSSEESPSSTTSSSKKPKVSIKKSSSSSDREQNKVKNKSLLSFDDEEDDD